MTGSILVATGTRREAAVLRRSGLAVIPGGGDPAALRARLEAAAAGAAGIVSFGMAGALADELAVGDWVVGDRLSGPVPHECDPAWAAALAASLPGARIGGFYADGRMIDTVAEKLALGQAHAALAVDMESHVAAQVAAGHGLPFAIVRCISDGARHVLPPAITVAMRSDGSVNAGAMLRSLVAWPRQLPDFIGTIAGFVRAMSALERAGGKAGLLNHTGVEP